MLKCRSKRGSSWARNELYSILLSFSVCCVLQFQSFSTFAALGSGGTQSHKLKVSDKALGQRIIQQGGRLLADYGSYQLYETDTLAPELFSRSEVEIRDDYNVVRLHADHLNTRIPETKALRKAVGTFKGKRLHLVQFVGPVLPVWREKLTDAGLQIISYIPENAYLVYGDAPSLNRLQKNAASAPEVQWEAPYLNTHKINPRARAFDRAGKAREIGTDIFAIQLVADPEANRETLALVNRMRNGPIHRQNNVLHYLNLVVSIPAEAVDKIASQPDVVSIQPWFAPRKVCERQAQIIAGNLTNNVLTGPGYLQWLATKNFTPEQFAASGFAVDVSDSGVDNGTLIPNHFGLFVEGQTNRGSRIAYNRLVGEPNAGSTIKGCDGHGTINAHIIGGYDNGSSGVPHTDASGYHFGLGIAPFVRLGASVIFDPDYTFPNLVELISDAYRDGARVSNNSWGTKYTSGAYDMDCQVYDLLARDAQPVGSTNAASGNQEMVLVFAAGNSGPGTKTVESPGTAKNVISVGAAENVHPFGGTDGSGVGDTQADSANDVVGFSARGPCEDGRSKPDLVAPGTHICGGVAQAQDPGTNGTADACFNANDVSGGVGGAAFHPAGQQFFTASSGTSHSAPCVSGGCALVRQYFINNFTNPPSAAMTKAFLMNSARYLTGAYANDNLWSTAQGMGEMNLGLAFDGTQRILRDQIPYELFTASGQQRQFRCTVANSTKPIRITLAWTDAPGNTTGDAYNNNLDLTVNIGGRTYKGNSFAGAFSTTNGTADVKNNVESVLLPPGLTGEFTVTVAATSVNSDGVPGNLTELDQDYALVVYNATDLGVLQVASAEATLLSENFSPTNGVIEPGETVTMDFALQNVGTANSTNLTATLLPGVGVENPSSPQFYGQLTPGSTMSKSFSFTATGTCGGSVTAVFQVQDGPTPLGTVEFVVWMGKFVPTTALTQNFDAVSAPALPTGWTTLKTSSGILWTTTTLSNDTAPNSAFASAPDAPGTAELISPPISIVSDSAQLVFRNRPVAEADPYAPLSAYDGGVLEISIDDGRFTDLLAAGGKFLENGYSHEIDGTVSTDSNPLAGRKVWSGKPSEFFTTTARLPASAAGHSIRFKWVFGTDLGNFFGSTGWYIDGVEVRDGYYSCLPLVTPEVNRVTITPTHITVFFSSVVGLNYKLQYKNTLADPAWTTMALSAPGSGGEMNFSTPRIPATRFYRVIAEK